MYVHKTQAAELLTVGISFQAVNFIIPASGSTQKKGHSIQGFTKSLFRLYPKIETKLTFCTIFIKCLLISRFLDARRSQGHL